MTHSKLPTDRYCRNSDVFRAMLIALVLLPVGCNRDEQQAGKAPTAQSGQPTSHLSAASQAPTMQSQAVIAATPLTDLESLVAPVALYPDALLAELLVASTYPLEVVQAARWLESKPDLATLSSKDWDASIMRLASVPDVIKMMNDHLDWTTQLGDAFLAKPAETMDAIQKLRKRATDSGFLKDTPEQKVTAKTVPTTQRAEGAWATAPESNSATIKATPAVLQKEVITIEPAKSDTVYLPQYNPETVYQAPLAPPPTTVVNVNPSAAPAPSYYPSYSPAATATTSSSDTLLAFGAGAVVGGLLTWGIMEWSHHDDDYYSGGYYPVSHYYGNSVCRNGNCWHGGSGYYGNRGNVNYNKNVNFSGNDINIDRGGVFSQNNLTPTQRPAGWQPNPGHRRGQDYPEALQNRLKTTQQPALAGQRPGASQTLPAAARGFTEADRRPAAGTLPAERRPSSDEIRERLAQKPGTQDKFATKLEQPKPATRDTQGRSEQGLRSSALEGVKNPGQATRFESQRGLDSRKLSPFSTRDIQTHKPAGGERVQRLQTENKPRQPSMERKPQIAERRAEMPQQAERRQAFQGREQTQQQRDTQRRSEIARPNAFEGSRNASATRDFSQRGAFSQQRSANTGNLRAPGGGGTGLRGGGGSRRR